MVLMRGIRTRLSVSVRSGRLYRHLPCHVWGGEEAGLCPWQERMARGSGRELFRRLSSPQVAPSQLSCSSEGAPHPTMGDSGQMGSQCLFPVRADGWGDEGWGPPLMVPPLTFCSKLSGVRKKLCRGTK